MNYVNYINHTLFIPANYYRRFEFDFPDAGGVAKRVALAVLPREIARKVY